MADGTSYNSRDIAEHLSSCLCYDSSVAAGVRTGDTVTYACIFRNNTIGDSFTDKDIISRELADFLRKLRLPPRMVDRFRSKRNRAGVITTTFNLVLPVELSRAEEDT